MTRVAAVDCGTNSVRLLVADLDPGSGHEVEHLRTARIVRLGEDVDRTGRLATRALTRTFAALDEYAELIDGHAVDRIRFCATSAVRDAANAEELAAGVRARLGLLPEVLTGEQEARLSFAGATRGLRDVVLPVLVADVGGGSTELVLGDPGSPAGAAATSVDVGSVRLTERLLRSDPPTRAEIAAATALVDEEIAASRIAVPTAGTVVLVSGTALTLAAVALGLPRLDRQVLDGARLRLDDLHRATERLLRLTTGERAALRCVHPRRADVIAAGALVLDRLLRCASTDQVTVSVRDILDGIAWSVA